MLSTGLTGDYSVAKNADELSANLRLYPQLTVQQQPDLNDWYDAQELQWLEQQTYYDDRY